MLDSWQTKNFSQLLQLNPLRPALSGGDMSELLPFLLPETHKSTAWSQISMVLRFSCHIWIMIGESNSNSNNNNNNNSNSNSNSNNNNNNSNSNSNSNNNNNNNHPKKYLDNSSHDTPHWFHQRLFAPTWGAGLLTPTIESSLVPAGIDLREAQQWLEDTSPLTSVSSLKGCSRYKQLLNKFLPQFNTHKKGRDSDIEKVEISIAQQAIWSILALSIGTFQLLSAPPACVSWDSLSSFLSPGQPKRKNTASGWPLDSTMQSLERNVIINLGTIVGSRFWLLTLFKAILPPQGSSFRQRYDEYFIFMKLHNHLQSVWWKSPWV